MRRHPFVVVPFLFYYLTCSRSLGSSDTALMIEESRTLSLSTHANHHNLTILMAWLFSLAPHPNLAFKANLVSVLLGGLAVAGFYLVVCESFRSRTTAALAASCLMVSHSMWWHSTIAEVYAFNALFMVIALWLLRRLHEAQGDRYLLALFFVAGLALFNHVQMGILAVGAAGALAFRVARWQRAGRATEWPGLVVRCALAFTLGAAPYLITFLFDARRYSSVSRALSLALGGDFKSMMFKGAFLPALGDLLYLVVMQFPSPFLLAVGAGVFLLARAWRGSPSLPGLGLMFLVNTGFFMFYGTWDKFAFLLPSFVILAFAGAFGVDHARRALQSRRGVAILAAGAAASLALPPYLYARLSTWGRAPGFWHARYGNDASYNSHDVAEYIANPDKHRYREYEDFAAAFFARLPAHAIHVDDDARMYYAIKYYQKYYGRRPDLDVYLLNAWGFGGWGLTQEQFAGLVGAAYERDLPFFLISIDYPYTSRLLEIPDFHYRFVRFYLDGRRWVYKLVTSGEEARLPPRPPVFTRLLVGAGPDTAAPTASQTFHPGQDLIAKVDFQINGEPFPLRFRWLGPDGSTYAWGEPMVVPFGCTSAWARLDEKSTAMPLGRWRVQAFSGVRLVGEVDFDVR